jgi:hypothetical protein
MRRTAFLVLGVLEALVAAVLLVFAWQLPGPAAVHDSVGRVERVSRQTGAQIRRLREQVHLLRESRPRMQELAVRLRDQMRLVSDNLQDQQIDYPTLRAVSDALGDTAAGLDGLAQVVDPKGLGQVGAGLGATADYLDDKFAPAATRAADQIEKATADLRGDALRLAGLLRAGPLDLRAVREVHDSLGKFGEGLERMGTLARGEQLAAMREGFKGLETSLSAGAEEVQRLAGYTYPMVTFNGLRPVVDQKQFWPEGEKIADGLRKASKGVTAAAKEMDGLMNDLPRLRESLEQSRKIALATRDALGGALKQQAQIEPLLKSVPEHAARLAVELPRVGTELARILRETARFKEVAALLRQTQKGIDAAVARWPELRQNLGRSAVLLRATQGQLKHVLAHRAEYEASLRNTLVLNRTFASALPLLTEQLEADLNEQEQSLTHLGQSIDEVSAVLPACSAGASHMLQTTRLLLCLVAGIFAVHGGYLALGSRLGPQPPA